VRLWRLSLVKKPQHLNLCQPQCQRPNLRLHLNRQKKHQRLPVQKNHQLKKVKAPRNLMRLPQKKHLPLYHPVALPKWSKSRLNHRNWLRAQNLLPTNC